MPADIGCDPADMPSFNIGNFRRPRAGSNYRSSSFPARATTSLLAAADAASKKKTETSIALNEDAGHNPEHVIKVNGARSGTPCTVCARWWILLMYCLLAAVQAITWNTFSPIFPAVYLAFPSWTSSYVSWLINVTNISFGLMLWPAAHLAQKLGPRCMTITSAVIIFTCAALRCLPLEDGIPMQVVMMISMLCNGAGGAWTGFGGPVLSELWFPASQRTMATAIAVTATAAGSALGFVVGPAVVGLPTNQTESRSGINTLFYSEAIVALLCLIGIIAYFPNRPRVPPSEAAAAKREIEEAGHAAGDPNEIPTGATVYFACCCSRQPQPEDQPEVESGDARARADAARWGEFAGAMVRTNSWLSKVNVTSVLKYWVVAGALGIPLGVYQAWSSVLYSCISDINVTESEAAWLGFSMTMSGCLGSVVVAAILDRFLGYLKLVTTCLMLVALVSFALFSANATGWFLFQEDHTASVSFSYTTGIIGGMALNTAVPLYFELIMETVYGWGDEGTGAMLTIAVNTLVQIVFLLVLAQEPDGTDNLWTAWTTTASMGICAFVMMFFRVEYRRLSIDRNTPLQDTGCKFDRSGCFG